MNNKKLNLILFGPPGSGKGTQAKILAEKFSLVHISTGDLFRSEIGNETPLGLQAKSYMDKGQLVPDEVTIGMLKNRVEETSDSLGYILDGFPRTIAQAEALDQLFESMSDEVTQLISLVVDDEEIVKRLLERGKTSGRSDDANEEVIRNRIQVYKEETSPIYEYYNGKNLAQEVQGIGDIQEINERLSTVISSLNV